MKSVTANLMTHLASEVTTVAVCWKLTTASGRVGGFTSHTQDIEYSGLVYRAAQGIAATTVQTTASLAVDNLDVRGYLDAVGITEEDVNNGVYDGAQLEVFLINYADISMGIVKLRRGFLGNVKLSRLGFDAEIRGLMERFQRQILELYTPACRADLGDSRCTVNLATYTVTGSITSFTTNRVFRDTTRTEANAYFLGGLLTFTSGSNKDLKMEVKQWTLATKEFELALPMRQRLQLGDTYSVYAGCDKLWETCKVKFNNIVNFRGEPYIPQSQDAAVSAVR